MPVVQTLQANGEVEVKNQTLQGIKKRLVKAKDSWVDELYHVLWAYWIDTEGSDGGDAHLSELR